MVTTCARESTLDNPLGARRWPRFCVVGGLTTPLSCAYIRLWCPIVLGILVAAEAPEDELCRLQQLVLSRVFVVAMCILRCSRTGYYFLYGDDRCSARQSFGQLLLDPTMAMPTVPLLHWKRHQRHFPLIMCLFVALFACLISLASAKLTVFSLTINQQTIHFNLTF
jgi:hypothetical protein